MTVKYHHYRCGHSNWIKEQIIWYHSILTELERKENWTLNSKF